MKEKLYTIPVNEAFEKDDECAFCVLTEKLEDDILNYILGPSYMEEDVRENTDKMGFCKGHYRQMYQAQNRLGVALMVDTHLKKWCGEMEALLDAELALPKKKGLFKKEEAPSAYLERSHEMRGSCYACARMQGRMDSYVDTFFYLWKNEEAFRKKVVGGRGFCLEHFDLILSEGKRRLSDEKYRDLAAALIPVQKENFQRLIKEVDWFVQKFDYRFRDEPWGTSEDSVMRAIRKLAGIDPERI